MGKCLLNSLALFLVHFSPVSLSAGASSTLEGNAYLKQLPQTWNWKGCEKRQGRGQRGAGWAAHFQTHMRAKGLAMTLKTEAYCSMDMSKTQLFGLSPCKKPTKLRASLETSHRIPSERFALHEWRGRDYDNGKINPLQIWKVWMALFKLTSN